MPTMNGRTRPIEKFAEASMKCLPEVHGLINCRQRSSADVKKGAVYGKCVAANYQNVSRDMCAKEFIALKDCYLVRSGSSALH